MIRSAGAGLAVLGLLLGACATTEWVRDYDGYVPYAIPESVYAAMIVDGRTGQPIPGATVSLFREDIRPEALPGQFVMRTKADRYGIVSFPWKEEYRSCHLIYDHPGYCPVDELGGEEEWVELFPASDLHGQLLDAQGRPAAGVDVEYLLGCPHSPAVRRAKTNRQGRFVLRDAVGRGFGNIWAPAPGATADWWSPHLQPRPGFQLEPVRPEPGLTVTGTLYDDEGQPVPHSPIYSTQFPRGPKTVTAEDGTFTLVGVAPGARIEYPAPGAHAELTWTPPPRPLPAHAPPEKNLIRIHPPGDANEYVFWTKRVEQFEAADGCITVETPLRGLVRLRFQHEHLGEGELLVNVDRPEVDVGPEAFSRPGLVSVLDSDGTPPGDVHVEVVQGLGGWWPYTIEPTSMLTGWEFQPGTCVRLVREDHATNYRVLKGKSPFVLRLGSGTLDLRLAAGRPVCWVDGQGFRGISREDDHRLVIRGLDAGPHTLVVGAPGRKGKVLRVVFNEGETRRIDLTLEPR